MILRIGLAIVILWFGLSELIHPAMWTSYIPSWLVTLTHFSVTTLVILNGLFEVVLGTLLAFGVWTRWVSLLLFLHMAGIINDVGLDAVGMRDVGLAFGLLSVVFQGNDRASLSTPWMDGSMPNGGGSSALSQEDRHMPRMMADTSAGTMTHPPVQEHRAPRRMIQ